MAGKFLETMLPPWVYRPDPPFRVIVFNGDSGTMIALHTFDTLREAVAWFVRFQIGPMNGRIAGVLDANHQILVGYKRTNVTEWFGTAIGFEEFAFHHDPLSVAVWEIEAQADGVHPTEIPDDIVRENQ
jgi:hypothetical protein